MRADRPPIESGRVTPTALCIHTPHMRFRGVRLLTRDRRAGNWLKAHAANGRGRSMLLLGLAWAGMDVALIRDTFSPGWAEARRWMGAID